MTKSAFVPNLPTICKLSFSAHPGSHLGDRLGGGLRAPPPPPATPDQATRPDPLIRGAAVHPPPPARQTSRTKSVPQLGAEGRAGVRGACAPRSRVLRPEPNSPGRPPRSRPGLLDATAGDRRTPGRGRTRRPEPRGRAPSPARPEEEPPRAGAPRAAFPGGPPAAMQPRPSAASRVPEGGAGSGRPAQRTPWEPFEQSCPAGPALAPARAVGRSVAEHPGRRG